MQLPTPPNPDTAPNFPNFSYFHASLRHPASGKYSSINYEALGRKSLQSLGSNDLNSRRKFSRLTRIRHRQKMWRKVGDHKAVIKFKVMKHRGQITRASAKLTFYPSPQREECATKRPSHSFNFQNLPR